MGSHPHPQDIRVNRLPLGTRRWQLQVTLMEGKANRRLMRHITELMANHPQHMVQQALHLLQQPRIHQQLVGDLTRLPRAAAILRQVTQGTRQLQAQGLRRTPQGAAVRAALRPAPRMQQQQRQRRNIMQRVPLRRSIMDTMVQVPTARRRQATRRVLTVLLPQGTECLRQATGSQRPGME